MIPVKHESSVLQYCTFEVEGVLCAIDVKDVQEVNWPLPLTEVPTSCVQIAGLVNLRGNIIVALDLAACLGERSLHDEMALMSVVVKQDSTAVSLLVDRIGDVISISSDSIERNPKKLERKLGEFVLGVAMHQDKNVMVLSADAIVSSLLEGQFG